MPGIVGRTESGEIVSSHFDDTLGLFELTLGTCTDTVASTARRTTDTDVD